MIMQRLKFLRLALFILITILIIRLYQLQISQSDVWGYNNTVEENTTRYLSVPPRRGEILASDGTTLLAESVPVFNIAVRSGSLPPYGSEERDQVLATLASAAELTNTLLISPATTLRDTPGLYKEIVNITGLETVSHFLPQQDQDPAMLQLEVPLAHTLDALALTQHYSDTCVLYNPVVDIVEKSNTRFYQSVVIKQNVPEDVALAISENMHYLPGAVIIKNYQRRYPKSLEVPSLSHILGYTGRINECELVEANPAGSWINGLSNSVSHIPNCGVVKKDIDPFMPQIPPYLYDDYIGKDGIEASYEEDLRGSIGIESVLVDALERPVSYNQTVVPVRDGYSLVLTIDVQFQQQVETILHRWLKESDLRREEAEDEYKREYKPITNGVIVAMNPHNGAVLAMASLPAYDNNVWVDPAQQDVLQNLLSPADPEMRKELERLSPLTNRAIAGQYPPGSVLKQFVGSVALEKHIVEPDTELRDPGKLVIEEQSGHIFTLPNSEPKDNGLINISDALKVSSNVFFATIAGGNEQVVNISDDDLHIKGLTTVGLTEGLEWFRLGKYTGIRLPGEANGRVPDPVWKSYTLREPWTIGDTYNTAIGQGYLEVTPLQLVNAAMAVANDGTIYRPQLVKNLTDTNGNIVHKPQPEELTKVPVDPQNFAVIREGMRRSVSEGLNIAAREDCSGLRIAGKTGTAEYGPLILKEDGEYARRSHSWFVGFAPYENPEIIVVALLEGTGDLEDGSSTLAVPTVTQVMQAYFGIEPPDEPPQDCPWLPQ